MSIFLALALAAAPAAPAASAAAAAPVDHAQHKQHAQHMEVQKHLDHCKDMMLKMHQGANAHAVAGAEAKPSKDEKGEHGAHH